MKAVVRYQYGNADKILIEEMPKPKPKPKEILIKVKATTVNRTDCGVISGEPYIFRFFVGWPKPRTPILGTDFAGVVEEIGSQVSGFKVGDKVWGFNDNGIPSQAEYIVYKEDGNILKIPDGFGFAEAVASAEAAHYAINFPCSQQFPHPRQFQNNGNHLESAFQRGLPQFQVFAKTPQLE
jgi:NADPH:quinone reductase-like Zn-dependent oxidoreductase